MVGTVEHLPGEGRRGERRNKRREKRYLERIGGYKGRWENRKKGGRKKAGGEREKI